MLVSDISKIKLEEFTEYTELYTLHFTKKKWKYTYYQKGVNWKYIYYISVIRDDIPNQCCSLKQNDKNRSHAWRDHPHWKNIWQEKMITIFLIAWTCSFSLCNHQFGNLTLSLFIYLKQRKKSMLSVPCHIRHERVMHQLDINDYFTSIGLNI